MHIAEFLQRLRGGSLVSFQETIALIDAHYRYTPTVFYNGEGTARIANAAGTNEGSCKIFAFARLHGLAPEQTLALFGDYYRHDVLQNPTGTSHANIRTFMRYGWEGIHFEREPLQAIMAVDGER